MGFRFDSGSDLSSVRGGEDLPSGCTVRSGSIFFLPNHEWYCKDSVEEIGSSFVNVGLLLFIDSLIFLIEKGSISN
jgi:hypothetical protein